MKPRKPKRKVMLIIDPHNSDHEEPITLRVEVGDKEAHAASLTYAEVEWVSNALREVLATRPRAARRR